MTVNTHTNEYFSVISKEEDIARFARYPNSQHPVVKRVQDFRSGLRYNLEIS